MPYVHAEMDLRDVSDDVLLTEMEKREIIVTDKLLMNTLQARNCPRELQELIKDWQKGRLSLTAVMALTK